MKKLLIHRGKNNVQKEIIPHDDDYIFNFDRYQNNLLNLLRAAYIACFKVPSADVVVVNSDQGLFLGFFLKYFRFMNVSCHLNGPIFFNNYWTNNGGKRNHLNVKLKLKMWVLRIACNHIFAISHLLEADVQKYLGQTKTWRLKTYTENEALALDMDFSHEWQIKTYVTVADRASDTRLVKGVDIFSSVASRVEKNFVLIGRQSEKFASENLVTHDKLEFASLIEKGECFVIPSRYEAFGRIGLEAVFAKKFVLASLYSGFGMELRELEPRLCFYPDDKSLISALDFIESLNPEEALNLKQKLFDYFSSRFNSCTVKSEYGKVFDALYS